MAPPERFRERPSERFDDYMDRCLYGPSGFYATEGTAGRRGGDFITSPEVGPLFGAVLAEALDGWWGDVGQPDEWTIYDVGCGPGTLLKAVKLARPDRPWRYVGVDRVDSPGADISELPPDLGGSVVVANELLDNLPFRVVEKTAVGFSELYVERGHERLQPLEPGEPANGESAKSESSTSEYSKRATLDRVVALLADVPVGTRAPVLGAASRWVTETLSREPDRLCLIDYGAAATVELASRGGWLRTYRQHQRGSDPLQHPGSSDITTDVAWDQLPAASSLQSQSEFLNRWGIARLVDEGRTYWKEHAAAPDLQAIRMRSRISEAEALLDPAGLGGWSVAIW